MITENLLAARLRFQAAVLDSVAERLFALRLPRFGEEEWQGLSRWAFDSVAGGLAVAHGEALGWVREAAAESRRAAATLEDRPSGVG